MIRVMGGHPKPTSRATSISITSTGTHFGMTMMNRGVGTFRVPPSLMSGFPKRFQRKGNFPGQHVLRWVRRPSTFLLTGVCLLIVPSLWFVSRTTAPTPSFVAELEGLPPSRPEIVEVGAPPPPLVDERERRKTPPLEPPVLPAEVFRDIPPEECLTSPLWYKRVKPSDYEFGCDEILEMLTGEKTPIGSGFIRDVYLVEWEGRKLAVKFLREDYEERVSERQAERVHQFEAAALDAVRGHPNIVDMLGICGASSVSEYYATQLDELVLSPGAKPLPISSVVSLALDAARGLQALHEAPGGPIVHYDIKPQQMMLDENGRIKINDLNTCQFLAADVDGNSCPFTMSATGVDSWRAPENIAGEELTEKVDVYALAMVYYSLLALYPPYTNVKDGTRMIKSGIPPPTDPSWHVGFLEIAQDMWQRDPKARPSAKRVVQRLEILQKQLALETG